MTSNKACTTGNDNVLHKFMMLFVFILQFAEQRQRNINHETDAIGLGGIVPRLIESHDI
jgi:hypothetical protein